jgi:predicted homoserine dehydrogenase-like protein
VSAVLESPATQSGILRRLDRWASSGGRSRAVVVGAGFVGRGLLHRLRRLPGIEVAGVVARSPDHGIEALAAAGFAPGEAIVAADASCIDDLDADIVVEATGALDLGVEVMVEALSRGRDVISMNAEVDATVGYLLHDVAKRSGAVYTIADGDQPGVLLRLLDSMRSMGFVPEVALNCKRHLDVHQSPGDGAGYAGRDRTSLHMTTAFGDGTKMQVENAVVANLTGLVPDRRGMHGVRTTVAGAADDVMSLLPHGGAVDFTLGGDFGAGVAAIGRADDPEFAQPYLRYFKMGEGPHYLFFRPYHLVHLEVAATLHDVILDRVGLAEPGSPPLAEVVAIAKRPLSPGDRLDGIGGWCCYGLVDTIDQAAGLLPIGLSHHATMTRPVAMDQPVTVDDVALDEDAPIVRHRREQDALVARP